MSEIFLILRRTERDEIINEIGLHVKYLIFLSDFNELEFSRHIFEKYFNINLHEICPVGFVSCGRTDRHTDG